MPSKTQVGIVALGTGFVGVAGFALWNFWERRRKQSEARVAALMQSKDDSEGEVAKEMITTEDEHVDSMMKSMIPSDSAKKSNGIKSPNNLTGEVTSEVPHPVND